MGVEDRAMPCRSSIPRNSRRSSGGFTLVELAVVIVIIGVLAAFAVPRFRDAVERAKAGEAFHYLASIVASQERYFIRQGTYASSVTMLDIQFPPLKYFEAGEIVAGETGDLVDSFEMTLTRKGASAGYGEYTVTFSEAGYFMDPTKSSIMELESINPVSTQ